MQFSYFAIEMKFEGQIWDSILIKDHAALRMLYRGISRSELFELLESGEVIEDYPNDFPFPSKLIFKVVDRRPLHAVVAVDLSTKTLIIVTIYEPDSGHFEIDFKTRKRT